MRAIKAIIDVIVTNTVSVIVIDNDIVSVVEK